MNPLQVAATFTGSPQQMFEQTSVGSMCSSPNDYLDSPPDAWWDASGVLHMLVGSEEPYPFTGSSLDSLQLNCSDLLFKEALNPTYSATDDKQWLTSVYTPDGSTYYGLVHNEWHGDCTAPSLSGSWAGAITTAQSSDGGATFTQPADYQIRVPPPWSTSSWCTPSGPGPYIGSFGPASNLIYRNGYYYMFFDNIPTVIFANAVAMPSWPVFQCVARSATPAAGSSWQVWTGTGWSNSQTTNNCAPIFNNPQYDGGFDFTMTGSVVYSTYLNEYVAIVTGVSANSSAIRLSPDLMNWSVPITLPTIPDQPPAPGDIAYLSFLSNSNDPSVSGRNFETIGQDAWLYYVADINTNDQAPRILMRLPVQFTITATTTASTAPNYVNLANAFTALESALKALVAQFR